MRITYKIIATLLVGLVFLVSCEEDHNVTRSKELTFYGPDVAYIGSSNQYEVAYFPTNDTRTWNWTVDGEDASATSGKGEYFDVVYNKPGTYTVKLSEGDKTHELEVEAVSKSITLAGDTIEVEESNDDKLVSLTVTVEDALVGEIEVAYEVGGTAVEGVDYEVVSSNPLVLNADSEEEDYEIVIKLLPDAEYESIDKFINVKLTDVTSEIPFEVAIPEQSIDDEIFTEAGIFIVDDLKIISIRNTLDEEVTEVGIISFEINLSQGSIEDVDVDYTISGTGVTDATPDAAAGTLTFKPGETSKLIYLQFNSNAFSVTQDVKVKLTGFHSDDEELDIDTEKISKTFKIEKK